MECDLCVVGAGAAGITIAREFAGSGVQVCLVESVGSTTRTISKIFMKAMRSDVPTASPDPGSVLRWHYQSLGGLLQASKRDDISGAAVGAAQRLAFRTGGSAELLP